VHVALRATLTSGPALTLRACSFGTLSRSTRLLIHFKELKFQLFELQEPLFCTATLYDTATRMRISESFHFDYNGQLELGTGPLTRAVDA
jgi:hypothetical protein